MNDLKISEEVWTPAEQAHSLWLRTARETAGSSIALVRTIKKHLARAEVLENVPEQWNSDFTADTDIQWARRTIKRWESGNTRGARPHQTSDQLLREALISAITELVPTAPAEQGWATFREASDSFNTERLERQQRAGLDSKTAALREPATEPHH